MNETQRIDKWLCCARFFKSRTLAAEVVSSGHVRVNGEHAAKPSRALKPGDVLTFSQGRLIRVIRVTACAQRRGPALEARALYDDLEPPEAKILLTKELAAPRPKGEGRPTKRDRRQIDRLMRNGI